MNEYTKLKQLRVQMTLCPCDLIFIISDLAFKELAHDEELSGGVKKLPHLSSCEIMAG